MDFLDNQPLPVKISLKEAYSAIRTWYQANSDEIQLQNKDAAIKAKMLIRNLPEPKEASELEIRAILGEIIAGKLEWGNRKSDGRFTMGAYAYTALSKANLRFNLSETELELLKKSRLWPLLYF